MTPQICVKISAMKKKQDIPLLGKRLVTFRKARGLTQQQLADAIGVTRRAIVYYERETDNLPLNIMPGLAKTLGVTIEELLGTKRTKETPDPEFAALWRRLKVLERFSEKDRKAVLQYVDVIEKKNRAEQNTADSKR